MSTAANPTDSTSKASAPGAESPTTARPLEMDDDDIPDSGNLPSTANTPMIPKPATVEDEAPPKPPRPLSPQQQAENTLKEAFPSIDAAVVKAVLIASGGRVEPAFNALLGMSDPDAVRESTPPPQPPRPSAPVIGSTPQSQLESDEQYARQLAEHYSGGSSGGGGGGGAYRSQGSRDRGQHRQTGPHPNDPYDENHSFIDDDLPIIKENLRKGFLETQTTVNGWIKTLKKKIDGDDEEDLPQNRNNAGPYGSQYNARRSGDGRRSGDYNRYDADPQVFGDDFAGMQLNSDGSARRSTRPLANPDLFKPTPAIPKATDGRKVSFQGGPPEDMELYRSSPKVEAKDSAPAAKQSKWQPLATVDPNPVGESENDPFSLGDSEDERETKDRVGGKEIRTEDAERLKAAAAEAMADSITEPTVKLEPTETSGTKDKIAEQKLSGKS